jgi:hypothetical protein
MVREKLGIKRSEVRGQIAEVKRTLISGFTAAI